MVGSERDRLGVPFEVRVGFPLRRSGWGFRGGSLGFRVQG